MSKRLLRRAGVFATLFVIVIVEGAVLVGCDDTKSGSRSGGAAGSGSGRVAGGAGHAAGGSSGGGVAGGGWGGGSGGVSAGGGGSAGATQITAGAGGNAGSSASAGRGGAGGGAGGTSGGGVKGPPVEPYFHAGSRLKPRVFRVGDLEVVDPSESGWYDSQTGNWCDFEVGGDGVERCFPRTTVIADAEPNVMGTYLDAACTRPALRDFFGSNCDGSAPHHVKLEPVSGCGYRTYKLGAALPSTTRLYGMSGGSCRRLAASSETSSILPLEEVPVETFVAMTRAARPRHPRMNAWVREGEDGSWQIVGFVDPTSQTPCFSPGVGVTPHACVPEGIPASSAFGDASCTSRIGFDERPRCSTRKDDAVLLQIDDHVTSCVESAALTGVWRNGGLRSVNTFEASNGVCQADDGGPVNVYVQGAAIEIASLPRLDVFEVGSGPVTVTFAGYDGVPFLPATKHANPDSMRFTDVARGETCTPSVFADGTWRCVPRSFPFEMDFHLYYQSENCTGSRAFLPPHSCSGKKAAGVVLQSLMSRDCAYALTETHELGEYLTEGHTSYTGLSMRCTIVGTDVTPQLLSVGKALDPDAVFATMERRVRN